MTETATEAVVRRAVDIVASAGGLVALSPLMAAIAIGIRRDSPGPVIFRQTRVGRHGRPFTLYKFRTMYVDSAGTSVTARGDSRITPVGRRLRATKLDELPQLLNVLVGDMSLVGPRPEVPRFVALWKAEERQVILAVRPGITDPVTLDLRHEEEILGAHADPEHFYSQTLLPQKATAYVAYLKSRSLATDITTVSRTLLELGLRR
jgi:lipopolysaccharide/colanic/teichoic acid biosynthesis glycosyltransferase